MKKILILILLILLPISLYSFSLFPEYDFTYFNTISLDNSDNNIKQLFNKTAFGFINNKDTNGIYLKLGYYTTGSYYSFVNNEGSYIFELNSQEKDTLDITNKIVALLGPAVRHRVNELAHIYLGLGLQITEIILNDNNLNSYPLRDYNTIFNIDFDFGYNFTINDNTSIRFGINSNYELLDFTYIEKQIDNKFELSTDVKMNFLAENKKPISPNLYLSFAKVFTNEKDTQYYRYTITKDKINTGLIEYL